MNILMTYDHLIAIAKDIIILWWALFVILIVLLTALGIVTVVRIQMFVHNVFSTLETIKNTVLEPLMILSAFLANSGSGKKKSKQQD